MTTGFKDHFSAHAGSYAAYRPGYPAAVFDWLAGLCPQRELAWDCACGNGQAALQLAARFRQVYATDASAEQISQARQDDAIEYRVEPAEQPSLLPASVDLITVAQAYHWLNHAQFVRAAQRVLADQGVLAIWTYQLAQVSRPIDLQVQRLYADLLGSYWPPERALVERAYSDLEFPFEELKAPVFEIRLNWTLHELEGYLGTWSASRRYLLDTGNDPLQAVHADLLAAWGDPQQPRTVRWPVGLRVFHHAPDA